MPKLLIISGLPHHIRDGEVVGWGPTTQEISYLASLFEEVHHVACLHDGPAPAVMLPYTSEKVRFIPVSYAGGDSFLEKAGVALFARQYLAAILRALRSLDGDVDVVHVRCPAPISFMAIVLLSLLRSPRKRWIKYAGNWLPRRFDSIGYGAQRWWLRRNLARAVVTVNGSWPRQPRHVASFVNPCLSEADVAEGRCLAARKPPPCPIRVIYVGRVEAAKGVGRAIDVIRRVRDRGVDVRFNIVGDGPERRLFEAQAADLGEVVRFRGWLPRTSLGANLAGSHLMLHPSDSSEGWPKVLSEGMAYGVVPIASDVSSIPQYLAECGTGVVLDAYDLDGFAEAIVDYASHPGRLQSQAARGVEEAKRFTYAAYLDNVSKLLDLD